MENTINIAEGMINSGTIKSLSGRPNGVKQRARFNLDKEDNNTKIINISIPKQVVYLSGSFLLGMFGDSVRHYGSREAFLVKYRFPSNLDSIKQRCLDEAIREALMENGALG